MGPDWCKSTESGVGQTVMPSTILRSKIHYDDRKLLITDMLMPMASHSVTFNTVIFYIFVIITVHIILILSIYYSTLPGEPW